MNDITGLLIFPVYVYTKLVNLNDIIHTLNLAREIIKKKISHVTFPLSLPNSLSI